MRTTLKKSIKKEPETKDPETRSRSGSGSKLIKADSNTCAVCGKIVYQMEKVSIDGYTFHKNCFTCAHCTKVLKPGNFAALSGKFYCKPHFKQLFALKGNYSEGFGEDKPTSKWQEQSNNE